MVVDCVDAVTEYVATNVALWPVSIWDSILLRDALPEAELVELVELAALVELLVEPLAPVDVVVVFAELDEDPQALTTRITVAKAMPVMTRRAKPG
jgi:hypothetical protein